MQTTQNTLPEEEAQAVIELYRKALVLAQAKVTHLQECLAILEAENPQRQAARPLSRQ